MTVPDSTSGVPGTLSGRPPEGAGALPADVEAMTDWLVDRVAEYRDVPAEEIAPDVPMAELGLDSVYVLSLCGDVEDRWGIEVEPTVAWDYPTVTALAGHLFHRLTGGPAS
jgi:acyl carrier protein